MKRPVSHNIHMLTRDMQNKRPTKGGFTVKNNNLASKLWDRLQKPLPR